MVHMEMGELKISANDTVIANFLLYYLEQYHKMYPDITIKVTNKTTEESLRLLRSGAVDMCFVNLPITDTEDLEVLPCIEIHDVLVGGEKYRRLAEKGIELKDLPQYPLMMLEEVSNSRRYISRYAEENGVVLNPILEIGSSDLLINFAKINLGLTYAIRELTRELEEKKLYEIPVNPPVPKRSIGMVRLKNVAMSHALQGFIDLMDLPKLKR